MRIPGKENAPLAQLVEQLTLNQWVPGSNPWRCTILPIQGRSTEKEAEEKSKREKRLKVSVINDEGPPVPIPNTVVKLICADNTWLETAR